jgi:membrane protease YdiL (CAAX protease family)
VAPLLAFMVFLMTVEGCFPDQHYILYPIKLLLVGVLLAWHWRALPSLRPSAILLSGVVGVMGVFLWVTLDPWSTRLNIFTEELFNRVVSSLGLISWQVKVDDLAPDGRNPFALYPAAAAWVLFGFRLLGISLVVPVMEELFWRGFLMRWLIREDFLSVPLGTFQPFSFWTTTLFFASIHGAEWPLGIIVGLFYGAWFVRTKNLGNVMLAHGVTNFLLAWYCLFADDWHFLSTVGHATMPK